VSPVTGILHPGEMGSYLAASAVATLGTVYWCSAGRSAATRARAAALALTEIPTLAEFCRSCELVIGICPPHAALQQARSLMDNGYAGLYVEANAVAPTTVQRIATLLKLSGITCIDGGIIGLPDGKQDSTCLYLSGQHADKVARCFAKGLVATAVLGNEIGAASALKLCYAAWNKGSTALLAAVLASAEAHGVRSALEHQWDAHNPGFSNASTQRVTGVARKAWRFGAEMREIAAMLQADDLPHDFFTGAADLYERLDGYKDVGTPPSIEALLRKINRKL
jgi:3-hydroxyisobutyrate dehydrogenase-like beta-hydroxyacid dehydrogenase